MLLSLVITCQFVFTASGTCAVPDDDVVVYYGTQDCTLWTPFEHIRYFDKFTSQQTVLRLFSV